MISFPSPVIQFDLKGKFIKHFESISEAERCTGVSRGCILGVTSKRRKSSHGFIWRYAFDVSKDEIKNGLKIQ